MLERLDRYLLVGVILAILVNVGINFTTSYTHIYMLSLHLGDGGTNARMTPVGIDTMLLALGLANVFATRMRKPSKWLRAGLAFGVFGTVLANAAYGAWHGYSGTMLAIWSPIALFITVESGLYMFKIAAEYIAEKKAEEELASVTDLPRKRQSGRRRPQNGPGSTQASPASASKEVAIPVLRGYVDPAGVPNRDPFAGTSTPPRAA